MEPWNLLYRPVVHAFPVATYRNAFSATDALSYESTVVGGPVMGPLNSAWKKVCVKL